jgi:hypothetical protein
MGAVKVRGGYISIAQEGGSDFGTLHIEGAFNMDGGTWLNRVSGEDIDEIHSDSTVTLGGSATLMVTTGSRPNSGQQIALIQAAQPITGNFAYEYFDNPYYLSLSTDQKTMYLNA